MKILYYNWVPLDVFGVGGGVAVYIRNIIDYISNGDYKNLSITFLSSGFYYDGGKPYLRREENYKGISQYSIVNSPIPAPNIDTLNMRNEVRLDNECLSIFKDFVEEHGSFDVIHFNSFEGLTTNVLQIKELYPNTKIFHSVHDYGLICPNVKLWNETCSENCLKSKQKFMCTRCMRYSLWRNKKRVLGDHCGKRSDISIPHISLGNRIRRKIIGNLYKYSHIWDNEFDKLRKHNIEMINKYCDYEICVSQRVADIMKEHGIYPEKIIVDYIGTKIAKQCLYSSRTPSDSSDFTILYMGYASEAKGFFSYLDFLESVLVENSNIILKFASKIDDQSILKRIKALETKYKRCILYDGYSHDEFPSIMESVNIGIVPPLWEDNLPQVAIEMISNGIPVVTSKNGGAQELNSHPMFSFSNPIDLAKKMNYIISHRNILNEYWNYSNRLTTMEMHVNSLFNIYNK